MAINHRGLELIKHFEGLRLEAYKDPVGIWTIGWGHTGKDVFAGRRITRAEAEQILKDDLAEHEACVEENVSVPLTADRFAALVSFAFNVGNRNFKSSTLRRKLNGKDYAGAADEFLRWVYGTSGRRKIKLNGLVRRRGQERNLFLGKPLQLGGTTLNVATGPAADPVGIEPAVAGDFDSEFEAFIEGLGLRFFKPYEFLVMGAAHSNPQSAARGLNRKPPRDLWKNIAETAQVLDRLRGLMGAPIQTTSVYRSPAYNGKVGGAKHSQHLRFCAVDFIVKSPSGPAEWASVLRQQLRTDGSQERMFKGGVGVYPSFVHVDTRGTNADW